MLRFLPDASRSDASMIQVAAPAVSWENIKGGPMPKQRKKSELPSKICPVCGRPFVWRRKWAKDWETVKFCSQRCREAK
ncbi:DUF2256 domain-containing protein [Agrobacterium cavarae]|uniref:DUF2256 domain-containing protein n=1 Tax=Agrobacterium cavarae TaxID=2528239 RepID=UPI00289B37E3|nr:DUF2256 domain-containing protein [Agrobacterium cavarae]